MRFANPEHLGADVTLLLSIICEIGLGVADFAHAAGVLWARNGIDEI